ERWAIAAIVVLPFLQWLLYDPKNGMPYETALITTSRARGFFGGFLYVGDPMRPFTSFWYHVGEMLSHVPGRIGSYLGIQIVFLTLWCLRNVLFYGVLRRILKLPVSVSFAAAAILSIDASDYAFHWVGQLNQWGMMFFGVAAIYFFGR